MNSGDCVRLVPGHDCIVSAARNNADGTDTADVASNLIAALSNTGIRRLIVVAGAGMLEVAPGERLFDSPGFPPHVRVASLRHVEALKRLQACDLDFGVFSPAQTIAPGARTREFRTGVGKLISDRSGKSFVSAEDYAVAMLDEVEMPQYVRQHFTIAY